MIQLNQLIQLQRSAQICTVFTVQPDATGATTGTVQLVLDSRGCPVFAGEVHENCNGTDTWTWSFSECICRILWLGLVLTPPSLNLGNIRIEIDRAIVDLHIFTLSCHLQDFTSRIPPGGLAISG